MCKLNVKNLNFSMAEEQGQKLMGALNFSKNIIITSMK